MQWAFAWEMRFEKLHLVTQDATTLKVDVFRMRRHEGDGQ